MGGGPRSIIVIHSLDADGVALLFEVLFPVEVDIMPGSLGLGLEVEAVVVVWGNHVGEPP